MPVNPRYLELSANNMDRCKAIFWRSWCHSLNSVIAGFFLIALWSVAYAGPHRNSSTTKNVCEKIVSPDRNRAIKKNSKIQISDTLAVWYTTVDLGYHDKICSGNFLDVIEKGRRQIVAIVPEMRNQRTIPLKNTYLVEGARDDAATYFAKMSVNSKTGQTSTEFYPIEVTTKMNEMLDGHLKLAWDTYRAEGTVGPTDIDSFVETEKLLDPRRKVTLVIVDPNSGRTLGVMRIYDGTPFPTFYFGDKATHSEAPQTNQKTPVERRYPMVNFRKRTQYLLEPGRLAKSALLQDGVLEYFFYSFGYYLAHKFGFLRLAPQAFIDGEVPIEITARNLRKFMAPFSLARDGTILGYGFHLDYIVKKGHEPLPIEDGARFEDLHLNSDDTETKFLLHSRIWDFMNHFFEPMELKNPSEIYPNIKE